MESKMLKRLPIIARSCLMSRFDAKALLPLKMAQGPIVKNCFSTSPNISYDHTVHLLDLCNTREESEQNYWSQHTTRDILYM